jgi:hypothetical protein
VHICTKLSPWLGANIQRTGYWLCAKSFPISWIYDWVELWPILPQFLHEMGANVWVHVLQDVFLAKGHGTGRVDGLLGPKVCSDTTAWSWQLFRRNVSRLPLEFKLKQTTTQETSLVYVRFEVTTAVTMKNVVFWDVTPCGSSKNRRIGGISSSIIRVTRKGELGTLAVTINRRTLRRNTKTLYFSCGSIRVWNVVSDIKGGT